MITINTRAISSEHYVWTGITDALIAACGFFAVEKIAHGAGPQALVGYMLGGVVGGQLGIWLSTKLWKDKNVSASDLR